MIDGACKNCVYDTELIVFDQCNDGAIYRCVRTYQSGGSAAIEFYAELTDRVLVNCEHWIEKGEDNG